MRQLSILQVFAIITITHSIALLPSFSPSLACFFPVRSLTWLPPSPSLPFLLPSPLSLPLPSCALASPHPDSFPSHESWEFALPLAPERLSLAGWRAAEETQAWGRRQLLPGPHSPDGAGLELDFRALLRLEHASVMPPAIILGELKEAQSP